MYRLPFPKASNLARATELGDLIDSDVCGPIRVQSKASSKYFCSFIDDRTGWCEVSFLKQKN